MAQTVVDYTDVLSTGAAVGTMSQQRSPIVSDIDLTDKSASALDVGGAYFMQDTLLGAMTDQVREWEAGKAGRRDPSFNPYSFYADEAKEKFGDMDHFLRSGYFHSTQSRDEWVARAESIRREIGRKETISRGGFAGHGLGLFLSFADLPTLVPIVGPLAKGGAAAKAGVFAANAAGITAAQEGLLHGMQHTRTARESFLTIGLSAPIGGGLGVFHHVLTRGHALHPDNPKNPLNVINEAPIEGHLSAAAAPRGTIDFADDSSLGVIDRIGYWARIPTAVAHRAQSGEARTTMNDIVFLGAPTKDNEAGLRTIESADDILEAQYMTRLRVLGEDINDAFVEMNKEAGAKSQFGINVRRDLAGLTGGRVDNVISEKEWNDAIFRRLVIDPDFQHSSPILNKHLSSIAPKLDAWRKDMAARMVKAGLITEDQQIENYLLQRWVSHRIQENPGKWEANLLKGWSKEPHPDWLKENYGLTPDQFAKLPDTVSAADAKAKAGENGKVEQALSKKDVLETWNVEADAMKLRAAEQRAEAALEELQRQKFLYASESKLYRRLEKNVHKVELREIAADVKAAEAERAALATERQIALAEHEAIQRSIDLGIRRENARAKTHLEDGPFAGERLSAEAVSAQRSGDLEKLNELLSEPVRTKKEPKPEPTFDLGKAEGRLKEANRKLADLDRRMVRAEDRLVRLSERHSMIKAKADELRAARAEVALARRITDKDLNKAQRDHKQAQRSLKAQETKASLPDWIAEARLNIADHTRGPASMFLDEVGKSGRQKTRGIRMDRETTLAMVDDGFLDTDVTKLMYAYTRDVGARLALHEKFGSVDLKPQIKAIQKEYDKLIDDAQAKGDTKAAAKLRDEREVAVETVALLRDRVLGRADIPSDPESALMFMGRVARLANFLRYMGRVMITAFSDLATITLNHGIGAHLSTLVGKPIAKAAKGMKDRELAALTFAGENGLLFSRFAKNMDVNDLVFYRGFGQGMTRKVSAAVEGGLRWGSEKMSILNGMAWWNSRHKFVTGQVMLQNILADAKRVAKGIDLPKHRVTEYARFGFEMDDLKTVASMIEKHGEKNEYGLIDPNGSAWLKDANGAEAHRRLLVLLKRATDEAVITPGLGDTPAFMSTQAGKVLFQFQSFGFASVNKYARNLRYKAVNGQAWESLLSVTMGLGLGTMAYAVSEVGVKGKPLSDKPAVWVREAIDRSGLAMYFSPIFNGGFKLAAPLLKEAGWSEADLPSRYRQASWLATFLGPSFGLFEDVQKFGTSVFEGELDQIVDKGQRLAPFRNLFYVEPLWRMANGTYGQ